MSKTYLCRILNAYRECGAHVVKQQRFYPTMCWCSAWNEIQTSCGFKFS